MSLGILTLSCNTEIWYHPQTAEVHSVPKSSLLTQTTHDIQKHCPPYWSRGTTSDQTQLFEPRHSFCFSLCSLPIQTKCHQFDYEDTYGDHGKDISVLKVKQYSPLSSHPQVKLHFDKIVVLWMTKPSPWGEAVLNMFPVFSGFCLPSRGLPRMRSVPEHNFILPVPKATHEFPMQNSASPCFPSLINGKERCQEHGKACPKPQSHVGRLLLASLDSILIPLSLCA